MALVVALIGSVLYLMHFAFVSPPPPRFAAPGDQAEANRQDIAHARDALRKMDRSFSRQERALFDRHMDELTQRAGELDPPALEMQIAKAVAMTGNGHTNLLGAMRGLTLNSLALRFYWFDDGLRLVAADPAYAELLGAKVLQIGGRAPEELVRQVGAYVGGSPSLARELAIYPMESPQALHAMGLLDGPDDVNLVLQVSDGQVVERRIPATPMPAAGPPPERTPQSLKFDRRELHWPRRALSPIRLPSEAAYPQPLADGRAWAHVLDGREMAFTLLQPNRFYWSTYLGGSEILFLQMNTIMDEPGQERQHLLRRHRRDRAPEVFRGRARCDRRGADRRLSAVLGRSGRPHSVAKLRAQNRLRNRLSRLGTRLLARRCPGLLSAELQDRCRWR